MPAFLQPKAPFAADAILVGDPGRALLLAQELTDQPKMANHARGLWGYHGRTATGLALTIQSTGLGAPSAAAVLRDLAELGVRRAVRVGTCLALEDGIPLGELLLVAETVAAPGSAAAFGAAAGSAVGADPTLLARLQRQLESKARTARTASVDAMEPQSLDGLSGVDAVDMQTLAVLAQGKALGIATAAVLIATETMDGDATLTGEPLERVAKRAGAAAVGALSP